MFRRITLTAITLSIIFASATFAVPTFDRFQALIGVDDGCRGRSGEAIFRVLVDGKEVFKSDVMLPGQEPQPITIPIEGVKELSLCIDDEGDGHGGDWGNWLNARFVDSKTGEMLFLTDLVREDKHTWIPANKDRNIILNKLSVNDKTYFRGLGCISGSEMVYRDWARAAEEREASVDRQNAEAAKRTGKLTLKSSTSLPQGLKLSLDGKQISEKQLKNGVTLSVSSVLTVTTNTTDSKHTAWWKSGAAQIIAGSRTIALVDAVQPTDRIVHKDIHPNRNVLIGESGGEVQGYWVDQPLPPTGPITFTLRDLPLATERALMSSVSSSGHLIIKASLSQTTETPEPASVTSSVLTVALDDKPIAYVFSDNPATYSQQVPLSSWPKKLECRTSPGADGSLGDWFTIDLGVQLEGMKEPLWLNSVQPSYSKFDYKEAKRLLVSNAWQLPGSGLARWDGLSDELAAREAGLTALASAKAGIGTAEDKKSIQAAVVKVLDVDPKQPDIRIVAAQRFKELGDLPGERNQWGLLAEESRADLSLMQQARERIDRIWDEMDPAPFVYPDDNSPTRSLRSLGRNWTGSGQYLNQIWTLTLDKDKEWTAEMEFLAPVDRRIAVLVNSRGVEVTAALSADGKTIAQKTARHPMLDIELDKAGIQVGTPLKLTVSLDPDITGIILTHTMEIAAWPVNSKVDLPTEEWDISINNDGSAQVSRTSKAPVLAAIPRTATGLIITGTAGYTIQEPISEYLVETDGRLSGTNLPLLVVPKLGEEIKISYTWPDAAYNVAVSRMNWSERRDNTYMQTPQAILDTKEKSVWRITHTPDDWGLTKTVPEPSKEDKNLFFVDPSGGLNAQWAAKDVPTPWIAMSHKNLIMYVPDNPNNRRWFPVWMKYVKIIYDREVEISGYENPLYIYIAPTGPGQLSGYGGASVGDKNASETWIAATGRMAPCVWRHGANVTGVDAHELHWINGNCMALTSPTWATEGFGAWLEQSGWEASELADSNKWRRTRLESIGPTLEMIRELGYNPIQSERPAWDALPNDTRTKVIHLGWYIVDEIAKKYGDTFWAKFWAEQKNLYDDVYPALSDRAKQILFVDELVRISGDPSLRDRFIKEWLFDLTPDPQDAPDRFLMLPAQPKVIGEDKAEFASPNYNDLAWAAASGPGSWMDKVPGMKLHRGYAWYRFTFDVPADFKTENLELVLGKIGQADETYLNGEKIGATGKMPPDLDDRGGDDRVYKIKPELLKPGQRNVLAVRIYNQHGGGIDRIPTIVSRIGVRN